MICHKGNVDKSRNEVFTDAPQAVELEKSRRSGTAAIGPERQFAAVQQYGRYRRNSGRSMDAANTAAPDPNLPFQPAIDRSFRRSQQP
jgi:hypothetical protein